jgi:hypothetical protein
MPCVTRRSAIFNTFTLGGCPNPGARVCDPQNGQTHDLAHHICQRKWRVEDIGILKNRTFMSEPNNPEMPKQRGWSSWSVIRKAQIIFTAISLLITIILPSILCAFQTAAQQFQYFSYVGQYVELLAMVIVRFCGWEPYFFGQGRGAEERFVCLVILTNALLGFLFGTLIGLLLTCRAKKK